MVVVRELRMFKLDLCFLNVGIDVEVVSLSRTEIYGYEDMPNLLFN